MENHPIPQDVTSFQFKLIGNMTIKQFAYLAIGAVLAWIFFSLPLTALIKFPLAFMFALSGAALAFVPIEGRPMDTMISLFAKALFSSDQYVYQKIGGNLFPQINMAVKHDQYKQEPGHSKEKLQAFLKTVQATPKNSLDEKEMVFFESISSIISGNQAPTPAPAPTVHQPISKPLMTAQDIEKQKEEPQDKKEVENNLEKEAQIIKKELEEAKAEENVKKGEEKTITHQKVEELEKQLNEVQFQRERLENELLTLQRKIEDQKQNIFVPIDAPKQETQHVRKIPQGMGKSVGLPIAPDTPNLIIGIVKDPRGNVLPNILVEIKDKEQNPVRAFKTNGLGQFASATPLLNGVYTVWFEDQNGKNRFDPIEITIAGEIVPVIEVFSIDDREELRKSLFG
ncbi:hypothetical protein C4559_01430 [Candidatus Microgenomates bacterium]|nr:MAG: hypothetical protein C4559_01430 [Candidatus Microgenomates bacterium]